MRVSRQRKKREQSASTWLSVALSGLALALTYIAHAATTDVGLERKLQEEELSYIRLYAWPKRMTASQEEILFTKPSRVSRGAETEIKPTNSETGSGAQDKSSPPPAGAPAQAPTDRDSN